MLKYYILLIALAASTTCDEAKKSKQSDDPLALMDRLVHYMFPPRVKYWPWYDIFQSANANPVEDMKLMSSKDKWQVEMFVKRFQPEDLRVRVNHRHVIVEGRRKEADEDSHFMVNRFVQNFALPTACREDEVAAVFEDGLLTLSAPKHELPPPPPERNVPIEVRRPVTVETTETTTTEKKEVEPLQTSSATPLDQLDLVEATTHVGKIRKKDLKTTKTSNDNEVTKGEGNGLDYSPIPENE